VLDILEYVSRAEHAPGTSELADRLDLPKASVHRILVALENRSYLSRDPLGRGFIPDGALRRLGLDALDASHHQAARHAVLAELAESTGEACNLVRFEETEQVYVDRVETKWPLRLRLEVGSRLPLHCTAAGKLLLALQPLARRRRLVARMHLKRYTPRTICDPDRLGVVLEETARLDYGVDDQEFLDGMVALAVPVRLGPTVPRLAVAIHAPILRADADSLLDYLPAMREAAASIAALICEAQPDEALDDEKLRYSDN
jgi:DNA-binding IclR family transcriptional regulator